MGVGLLTGILSIDARHKILQLLLVFVADGWLNIIVFFVPRQFPQVCFIAYLGGVGQ